MLGLLRRNRDFRFLVIAMVVSLAGDWFATVALAGVIIDKTNSDFFAAMVFVAASLPGFLMSPFAGPLADRLDRRRIMIGCTLLQGVAAVGFLFASSFWVLGIASQVAVASLAAFYSPASNAALPNLVPKDDLPRVVAMMGTIWGAMLVLGSGLGALVAAAFGRQTAFALDALSFFAAALAVSRIRGATRVEELVARPPVRPLKDTREAIRYARNDRWVSSFLLSKFGFGLGSGVVGLLAVLAKRRFGHGDSGTGLLLAARGTGVVVAPILIAKFGVKRRDLLVRLCGAGAVIYGLGYLAVSRIQVIGFAAALVLFAHLGGGSQWNGATIGLQQSAPDEMRGRLLAADFALVTLSMSISLFIAGFCSERFGPTTVITGLGALQVVWGSFYLWRVRSFRGAGPAAASVA